MRRSHFQPAVTAALAILLLAAAPAAPGYEPADQGQRPANARILPDRFLRGFDPITAYFPGEVGPGRGHADQGAELLRLAPSWPGAWHWADRKTLQFRPAEPWPALARFSVDARGTRRVLTTMMSAPSAMSPHSGSDNLRPFRSFTVTFPQALPLASLKQMIRLEVRDLPGLADSPRRPIRDFALSQLPRGSQRDAAVYAVTLDQDVPEGSLLLVEVSLALGDEDKVLWTGKLSTRRPFHLEAVRCGGSSLPLSGVGQLPKDTALACGNQGDKPQLVFSAPVKGLELGALKKLVRLEPAVPDLTFELYGSRVSLRGSFQPDVLYRMRLGAAPVRDESGRALRDPGEVELYFYLGWKSPYLRWSQSTAILESQGPRMLPLVGYGDARADVRVYRVDPLFNGLWPFPDSPVVVQEESAPPFPGEEPTAPAEPSGRVDRRELVGHLRLLGSPLVSKVVDLPLAKRSGATRFGLDLAPLLDDAVGRNRPGTYLVGLRRLTGAPKRSYVRVQITNLSLTTVEEQQRAVLYVRTLDRAEPVRGARVALEISREVKRGRKTEQVADTVTLTTDGQGRAELEPQPDWRAVRRISVRSGDDVLVIDPREPPPQFASNHWSVSSSWLQWLGQKTPPARNDKTLAFLFTERPIYRPGEPVFVKGWIRSKEGGELRLPGPAKDFGLRVEGPGGQSWELPFELTALAGFAATFEEKEIATGRYSATVYRKVPRQTLATRSFQIEAYRIPTFEVQLSSPAAARLDAPFKVKALARYYAGGNVAGQPVSWTVTRHPLHYVPEGREGFLFADSSQFARSDSSQQPSVVTRSARLDDGGADELEINPALDLDGSPRLYRFEATVTGPDDQPVSAVQDVRALPPFLLGMKLQRYAEKAFELKPEIIAVGVDGKLLAGQQITVRLFRRVWHNLLREAPFATGKARYTTEQEDVKLLEKTITSEGRSVVPSLPIPSSGVFVVELFARDKLGRVQTLTADLYVGGAGAMAWPKSREGVFELTTDKKAYEPGETARLIVKSPFQTGTALIVVEEPAGNRYAWREVAEGKAVHEIRIDARHVPNLPVHVVLMRGRLGAGEGDDARYRPQTVASSLDLKVEPVRNRVAVGVTHPETARPGTKVDFTVTLADERGRPLAGEVTFWLVDEAVLSLAQEATLDPLSRMIAANARVTSIRDTRNQLIGRLLEQDEEPGGDGEDENQAGRGKRVVRKNFKTVPFYQATLTVGPNGKVVVPVTLSDDLTNFKVRAVAASGATRFGHKQTTLRVRLPVLVQPQLPRFVRQGDRFWAGGVARLLEGAEGAATVELEIAGPADSKGGKRAMELKKTVAASHLFPVIAQTTPAAEPAELTVRMDVTRKSDGVGDAFEVKLPVLPDRSVEHFAWFERLKPGQVAFKPFPEPPRPGTATQSLLVTSEPGVLELAAGLEYLAAYPHGCLEQKMSQLLPNLSFAGTLKKLGLEDRAGGQLVAVKRLLSELPVHQDPQGFFAFWPGGTGSIALTAQAAEFMALARRQGLTVDEKVHGKAVDALKRALRSDFAGLSGDYRLNEQTAAVRALVRLGQLDEHYLIDLYHHRAQMDLTSVADLTAAMSERPSLFGPNLAALESDLWGSVVTRLHRGQEVYQGLRWRRAGWSGGYLGSRTSALAAVFESLLLVKPDDPRHALLRDALVAQGSAAAGFGSTHDNRRALTALALYLERASTDAPKVEVELGGQGALSVDGKQKVARREVRADAPLVGTVRGGEVGARIAYTYLPATPGDSVEALKQGFIVSRGLTLYPADGGEAQRLDDEKGATRRVAVGDVLELHTRLVNDEQRHHVALIVPFAAGLEPLNPELQNASSDAKPSSQDSVSPTYVQRLDHEVRYYFTTLPRGTQSFHFRVRAVNQGSFVHPAPWSEQMYRQEVRGRGEGMRVVVTGNQEK